MASGTRWIRLDVSWEDSAWLDALDGVAAGCWPRLLCWVKRDGIGGSVKRPAPSVVARRWRVPVEAVLTLEAAATAGDDPALVVEDGKWIVTGWKKYQEPDSTTAERSKRYRESKSRLSTSRRDGVANGASRRDPSMSMSIEVSGTNQSTRTRKIALAAEWQPSEAHHAMAKGLNVDCLAEAEKMRDWAASKGEKRVDWDAQFRNWLKQAKPTSGAKGQTDELGDIKALIRAGGNSLMDPWQREFGFEKAAKAWPTLWAKHEAVMRKINYTDLKAHIESRNGFEYSAALQSQVRTIHAAA